jgi:pimeloyl-ACP methyl ester carboxylesterase
MLGVGTMTRVAQVLAVQHRTLVERLALINTV